MEKIKLSKGICFKCLHNIFPFGSSLTDKFEDNWKKGQIRCPAYYFASVCINFLPDDCPYDLEQKINAQ